MSNYTNRFVKNIFIIFIFDFLLAPIPRINIKRDNRILGGIIAGLILSIISLTALAFFIAYRK